MLPNYHLATRCGASLEKKVKTKTSPKKPQPATIAAERLAYQRELYAEALRLAVSYLSPVELDDFERRVRRWKKANRSAPLPPPSRAALSRSRAFAVSLARELLVDADQVAA